MVLVLKNALSLLDEFSVAEPELGLSEITRRSGQDKATVHRFLTTLRECDMLEQNAESRKYRLGAGLLHLARIRELSFPFAALAQPAVERLSELTGETAHCSTYMKGKLAVVAVAESKKASRVSMSHSETLPLHATAAGIAYLSVAPKDLVAANMKPPFKAFTPHTCRSSKSLLEFIRAAQLNGYAKVDSAFEEDVVGIAAAIVNSSGSAIGAVAVAVPSHRLEKDQEQTIITATTNAAREISRLIGSSPA